MADPKDADTPIVTANPWVALRRYTDARIALGRTGVSLPTQPQLAFQLAHAQARDAVHLALDAQALRQALSDLHEETIVLHSAAIDRDTYLQRPDLGRRLSSESRALLMARLTPAQQALVSMPAPQQDDVVTERVHDVAFVVADGLSALAIANHAVPFLSGILPRLKDAGWRVAPLTLVNQGRVAVADEVGQLLRARMVVILIGERPGLSSPDSMGLYLTWMPRVGLSDASRNCISNVRPAGLPYDEAVHKLHYLMSESCARALSGVALKDESTSGGTAQAVAGASHFLLPQQP
jgi:ethanolamine ammonia-lyase small subunit